MTEPAKYPAAEHPVFQYKCPGALYLFEPWAARLDNLLFGSLDFGEQRRPVPSKRRKRR